VGVDGRAPYLNEHNGWANVAMEASEGQAGDDCHGPTQPDQHAMRGALQTVVGQVAPYEFREAFDSVWASVGMPMEEMKAAFLHLLGIPRNGGVFGWLARGAFVPHFIGLLRICCVRSTAGMSRGGIPPSLTYAPNREMCAREGEK